MTHGESHSPGGQRLRVLPLIVLAGLLYGFGEFALQAWLRPSPLGVPGDSGGSIGAYLALGVFVLALPALILSLIIGPWRARGSQRVALGAAIAPTLWLAVMRLGELQRWSWVIDEEGVVHGAFAAVVAATLALVVAMAVERASRAIRWSAAVIAASVALCVLAPVVLVLELRVPGSERSVNRIEGPNVLLLTIDTLRADAVSIDSDPWPPGAPSMARRLAATTSSVSSWTRPSMASLFSAAVPTAHGADDQRAPSTEVGWWIERFEAHDYATAAVVANPHLSRRFGFDRGFEFFEHFRELEWLEPVARSLWAEWASSKQSSGRGTARADRLVSRAMNWLGRSDRERPWMLWVHLMDPHVPYHLRGIDGALDDLQPGAWIDALRPTLEDGSFDDIWAARAGEILQDPAQRQALRRLYQTEVDFALHHSARLIEAAGAVSQDRGLLWIMTSDHGEEFWDDGGFEHGHTLHASVLDVPFWAGGDQPLGREDTPRRLIDLGPWLMETLGWVGPDFSADTGLLDDDVALIPFAVGQAKPAQGLLAEGLLYGPPQTLLRFPSGGRLLRDDSNGEIHAEPAEPDSSVRDLLLHLDLWRERNATRGRGVKLSDDLIRQLRAVGYVQ